MYHKANEANLRVIIWCIFAFLSKHSDQPSFISHGFIWQRAWSIMTYIYMSAQDVIMSYFTCLAMWALPVKYECRVYKSPLQHTTFICTMKKLNSIVWSIYMQAGRPLQTHSMLWFINLYHVLRHMIFWYYQRNSLIYNNTINVCVIVVGWVKWRLLEVI